MTKESKLIPSEKYKRLFNAVDATAGFPSIPEMDGIIKIVHEDFPDEEQRKEVVDWRPVSELKKPEGIILALFPNGKVFVYNGKNNNGIKEVIKNNPAALYKEIVLPNTEVTNTTEPGQGVKTAEEMGAIEKIHHLLNDVEHIQNTSPLTMLYNIGTIVNKAMEQYRNQDG